MADPKNKNCQGIFKNNYLYLSSDKITHANYQCHSHSPLSWCGKNPDVRMVCTV
jgi:hypothetical protein